MSDPRKLLDALFERPDRTEWTDAEAAEKLANAVCAVLDYADDLNKVDLYAAPAHCLRTLISAALEAK